MGYVKEMKLEFTQNFSNHEGCDFFPLPFGERVRVRGRNHPEFFLIIKERRWPGGIRPNHTKVLCSRGLGGMCEQALEPLQDSFTFVEKGRGKAVGPKRQFREKV